jgi:hypothetical protein
MQQGQDTYACEQHEQALGSLEGRNGAQYPLLA